MIQWGLGTRESLNDAALSYTGRHQLVHALLEPLEQLVFMFEFAVPRYQRSLLLLDQAELLLPSLAAAFRSLIIELANTHIFFFLGEIFLLELLTGRLCSNEVV